MQNFAIKIKSFPQKPYEKLVTVDVNEICPNTFSECFPYELADKIQKVYQQYKNKNVVIRVTNNKNEPLSRSLMFGVKIFVKNNRKLSIR